MTARIVVTGFEPWEHGTENPTLEVLDRLDRSNDVEGELSTVRLPVDSSRLAGIVGETLDRVRPDLWISLGLAPGSSVIAVERIAANVLDPDTGQCRASTRRRSRLCGWPGRLFRHPSGQGDHLRTAIQRDSDQDLQQRFDLWLQSDDVHDLAPDRTSGALDAGGLYPYSCFAILGGATSVPAGRNALDVRRSHDACGAEGDRAGSAD